MRMKTFLFVSSVALLGLAGCDQGVADSAPAGTLGTARQALGGSLALSVDTTGCNTNVAINGAIGQSFKVPGAMTLDHLDVFITPELYYATSYNLEVYDGEGTGGTKLATSAIVDMNSRSSGQAASWYSFAFASGPTLAPSHAYTFRLVRLSAYSGGFSSCKDVYADGIEYWLGTTASGSSDVSFRVYQTIPGAVLGDAPCNSHVQLRSWTGDYLHRPDSPQGVTTWSTGIGNVWTVECPASGVIELRSWKDDYLHRPDSPQGVTTWSTGTGNVWTVEPQGLGNVMLRSWKGDYLNRPDAPQGVTTASTGSGNQWAVEIVP